MNANYINVRVMTYQIHPQTFLRGKGEKSFIATQAPVDYTLERFW